MAFVLPAAAALSSGGLLSTIGAGVSAAGTLYGALAQGQNASYQAQIADNNAVIASQNAARASQAGQIQAETEGLKQAEQIGAIKAGIAASGTDVNSGSAVKVESGQRETAALDQETIAHNALLQSYGYQQTAANDTAQAGVDRAEAAAAPIGGILGATGGLLSKWSSLPSFGSTASTTSTNWSTYPTVANDQT